VRNATFADHDAGAVVLHDQCDVIGTVIRSPNNRAMSARIIVAFSIDAVVRALTLINYRQSGQGAHNETTYIDVEFLSVDRSRLAG
jgi:hypothetical protein